MQTKLRKGFTLVELIITIVGAITSVATVLIIVTTLGGMGSCGGEPADYRQAAISTGTQLGLEVTHVSCATYDSDWDGYIRCSVRVKGSTDLLSWECTPDACVNQRQGSYSW